MTLFRALTLFTFRSLCANADTEYENIPGTPGSYLPTAVDVIESTVREPPAAVKNMMPPTSIEVFGAFIEPFLAIIVTLPLA